MSTLDLLKKAASLRALAAGLGTEQKNAALAAAADAVEAESEEILRANEADIEAARPTLSPAMIDRLTLTPARISGMAEGIRALIALPDPVGQVLRDQTRPDGLRITRVAVPMGVIAIIYESRPNVTSDAAALALKSGNVCVLRSGKEAHRSASAVTRAMQAGLRRVGLPAELVQIVEDTSRASAHELMTATGLVDLLIPRGGAGLIRACVDEAKVPCIETGTGICHLYVDRSADIAEAVRVIENAKTSRPSVCNAEEVCLVHRDIAPTALPALYRRLVIDRAAAGLPPVELRLDPAAAAIIPGKAATDADFDTEFLDYILAVRVVDSTDEAIAHIAAHSTHHSDGILTRDEREAERFCAAVDSAAVYVNASTRFTDGGEFGLGCEMGISTQRLHARGPLGLAELCTYKYIVRGHGNIR